MDIETGGITGRSRELLARLTARGRQLVTVDDAVDRLDLGRAEAAKLMARWTEQGWLRRVRRGLYLAVPVDAEHPERWTADPLALASAVWSPCYFTGWTAANHWGLTEQVFETVVVKTTVRVRAPRQTLLDHRYLVGHVGTDRLAWGIRREWIGATQVQYADAARVIVDVLDDPGIGGGIRHCEDMLINYMAENDPFDLIDYGDRFGNAAIFKRLGYLAEVLQLASTRFRDECEARLSTGIALLDPTARAGGERNARWHLRVNVRLEQPEPS